MRCPECWHEDALRVKETNSFQDRTVRTRRCNVCSYQCKTVERLEGSGVTFKERIQRKAQGKRVRMEETVSIFPFVSWIKGIYDRDGNVERVAFETGLGENFVRSIVRGTLEAREIPVKTVDEALTRYGHTFLWELYPELYPGLLTEAK